MATELAYSRVRRRLHPQYRHIQRPQRLPSMKGQQSIFDQFFHQEPTDIIKKTVQKNSLLRKRRVQNYLQTRYERKLKVDRPPPAQGIRKQQQYLFRTPIIENRTKSSEMIFKLK